MGATAPAFAQETQEARGGEAKAAGDRVSANCGSLSGQDDPAASGGKKRDVGFEGALSDSLRKRASLLIRFVHPGCTEVSDG